MQLKIGATYRYTDGDFDIELKILRVVDEGSVYKAKTIKINKAIIIKIGSTTDWYSTVGTWEELYTRNIYDDLSIALGRHD